MTAGIPLFDGNTQHDMQKEQKEQHDGFTLNFRNKKGRPRRSFPKNFVVIEPDFWYNLYVSVCHLGGVSSRRGSEYWEVCRYKDWEHMLLW